MNNSMNNSRQRKKHTSPSPAPFLSLQVQDQNRAVYVGNIPLDERTPCPICCKTDGYDSSANNVGDCRCAIELKAFLRDRINAAFKVPIEKIGIRTCRIFSVVTNVYSNSTSPETSSKQAIDAHTTFDADNRSSEVAWKSIAANANANTNLHHRSGRRLHRAACVEFDDPKIAEHTLALKFTSFHFHGQPNNRSSLRMRRWTMEPPQPPPLPTPKSGTLGAWSSKPRQPPPPPRPKSVSPKISNLRRQHVLPNPPPRPKSVSPNIFGRKQQQQQQLRNHLSVATSISERDNPPSLLSMNADLGNIIYDDGMEYATTGDGRLSPSFSSCAIYVGNIPFDATSEDLREFFFERMNKAFHGVTPPEIIRLGMHHRGSTSNNNADDTAMPRSIDAYIEFQDSKVTFRATQLKNRRWYAKKQKEYDNEYVDETYNEEEGVEDKEYFANDVGNDSNDDESSSIKHGRYPTPLLEIEVWDPTKHDTRDFYFVNENNTNATSGNNTDFVGSISTQAEMNFEYGNLSNYIVDGVDEMRKPTVKASPPLSRKIAQNVAEAREYGFLICTNPNKTPKCDHLFTIKPQTEEESNGLGTVNKARMCHGYSFQGKVCRNHKKARGVCPFAHIDSLEQLKDPHDILALLYYVHNNDEVQFIPGTGCTPQEYISRQNICYPKVENGMNRQIDSFPEFSEQMLWGSPRNLQAVQQELSMTQQQLRTSERTRQSLLEQFTMNGTCTVADNPRINKLIQDEKDIRIRSLKEQNARLREDLQGTSQKWKDSELDAEKSKRDYEILQEKYESHLDKEGKSQISADLLQSEVLKLTEELQQSRSDYLKLPEQTNGSPNGDKHQGSWPEFVQFDNFLERSIPTLMQMTGGTTDDQHLPPRPRLADIPVDASSRSLPYKGVIDCKPIPHLGLVAAIPTAGTTTSPTNNLTAKTDEESLALEISYLVSCYGNQVSVMNGATTSVTRFMKLPMNLYKGRDIDVALVLTLPNGYPWNGIVKITSDPRLSNHFGAEFQNRKIVSDSISGLLNVCRWEAEACQGNPHVLMNIMKSAERWVKNDWKVIQKKNLLTIDQDSPSHSHSNSFSNTSNSQSISLEISENSSLMSE